MGKLSKTLTILGGAVLAGVAYSLWKDKQELEEENDELYEELANLKKKNMEQDLEDDIVEETKENPEDIVF
ncbi:hypothetical protein [Fusobacterium periodonticum]|jgi:hypothetical protein|uniref:Uncharacterized protein n=1 Tax=Fusobacterium periodonticum 1_1_41FAA TaxID=469621 RepID=D6LDD6_9FUSO|nr:hypothetical protein [Fusobacterium periodonticum]EFG29626.1 hypothetical protein HMPREF0400_02281 [Fusobacterium periodonticum 1_1_41FAA]